MGSAQATQPAAALIISTCRQRQPQVGSASEPERLPHSGARTPPRLQLNESLPAEELRNYGFMPEFSLINRLCSMALTWLVLPMTITVMNSPTQQILCAYLLPDLCAPPPAFEAPAHATDLCLLSVT
jgi:hypothetical protein